MRNRSLVAIVLSVVLVAAGCSGGAPTGSSVAGAATAAPDASTAPAVASLPVLDTPMEGPTVINVPSDVISTSVVTAAGASIAADGVAVAVPAGGVTSDTTVVVKRLNAPFHMNVFAPSAPTDAAAIPIGHPYDFGPAGVTFAKPVEVAVPYDPQLVPAGTDPGRVAAVYFNGTRWVVAGGKVDTAAHTVTVRLTSFDGVVVVSAVVATVVGIVANRAIHWYYGPEAVKNDPISDKQAAQWITTNDPTVKAAAASATVYGVPLGDKKKMADYLEKTADPKSPVTLTGSDGKSLTLEGRWSDAAGTNWQKPADFLTKGDMRGDCTDVTNTLVSMFRSMGYPAKSVFGYAVDKTSPHVWGEVLIGDKMYLIDEMGSLQKLDVAMSLMHLIRPDASDARNAMWDENGEAPYEAAWWTKVLDVNGTWRGTLTFTEMTIDADVAKQAEEQGCSMEELEALKGKALPMTMTIEFGAMVQGTSTTVIDMSSIKDTTGKPLKSDPQTMPISRVGNTITFHPEQSSGSASAMSGVVMDSPNGGAVVMQGTMTITGKGFSAKAVWTVSPA